MEKKIKLEFNEGNFQESISYVLVKEFNLKPNILRAQIHGDGHGEMILGLEGDEDMIDAGIERINGMGISAKVLRNHIERDEDRCFSCGACVSICPTRSFYHDPETWDVKLNTDVCIACGSCISACSVKALKLFI